MKAYLLYPQKEWINTKPYFDEKSVIQDLGLRILYMMAARKVIMEGETVKAIDKPDSFLEETMKKVMLVPLESAEEIRYRQEIIKDCLGNSEFIIGLYEISQEILKGWDDLGRRAKEKVGTRNSLANLITDIRLLQLFVHGLKRMKDLFAEYEGQLKASGLLALKERLYQVFPDKLQEDLLRIIEDISFFAEDPEAEESTVKEVVKRPRLVLECSLGGGMKFQNFKLEEVTTLEKKYRNPNSAISKVQGYLQSRTPDSVTIQSDSPMQEHAARMEYEVIQYIMSYCNSFTSRFHSFFDQLHLQTAFYRGAVNLKEHMNRFQLETCFPTVGNKGTLRFEDLKEVVMCMEQRIVAVGNTCDLEDAMLLIVTGANQGGKSTFLRSIGIAQVMMQCGLMVTAKSFESGIFPALFTHFTRREDSEMNSGRLDEELGRMSRIIDNLGEHSMILLNESFATTTEKEGSVIAYDIIKALTEAGVKILTVTHLLSFAQRMYDEAGGGQGIEFFSAQRLEDGRRTFKMIQHAPELTSFGLDLYERIVRKS